MTSAGRVPTTCQKLRSPPSTEWIDMTTWTQADLEDSRNMTRIFVCNLKRATCQERRAPRLPGGPLLRMEPQTKKTCDNNLYHNPLQIKQRFQRFTFSLPFDHDWNVDDVCCCRQCLLFSSLSCTIKMNPSAEINMSFSLKILFDSLQHHAKLQFLVFGHKGWVWLLR
jgi:hypothetical protein